jgi:hypothetical protein
MGSYIRAAQTNIRSIVERVAKNEKADVHFALVAYRDHPPQDSSFVTQVHPFTSDLNVMNGYVNTMSASGGGDGPEAVTAALDDALRLPWRVGATKIAVLIADAPPHGLEPSGDGFPNGDPLGRDPLAIAREMAVQEITCYTVGCEPALGDFRFARDFMCTLAEITGGQAVALASASLLAEVIVNGSAEEICMTLLQREVEDELDHVRALASEAGEHLDEDTVHQRATTNLHARNMKCKQMRTDGGKMKNAHYSIWHGSEKQTLAAAKVELCAVAGVERDDSNRISCRKEESLSCHVDAFKKTSSRKREGILGRAFKSVFGRGARRSETENNTDLSACDEVAELGGRIDELCELSATIEPASVPTGVPSMMSKNVLAEDFISVEQVSRISKRSLHRKAGMS